MVSPWCSCHSISLYCFVPSLLLSVPFSHVNRKTHSFPCRYIQYTYTHTHIRVPFTHFSLSLSTRRIHAHILPTFESREILSFSLSNALLFARFVCLSVWPSLRDESPFKFRSTRDFNSPAIRTGLSRVKGRRSTSGTRQTREYRSARASFESRYEHT